MEELIVKGQARFPTFGNPIVAECTYTNDDQDFLFLMFLCMRNRLNANDAPDGFAAADEPPTVVTIIEFSFPGAEGAQIRETYRNDTLLRSGAQPNQVPG